MRVITLVEYDETWPLKYAEEVKIIKRVLSDNLITAYHIGSTAITGIQAKPVIDILLEVRSLSNVDDRSHELGGLGYEAKGEYGIAGRRFFQKGLLERTHHVHVYETGNHEIERHSLFVEYLNSHPGRATEYERLKIGLVCNYKDDPVNYSKEKSLFIKAVDKEAFEWRYS